MGAKAQSITATKAVKMGFNIRLIRVT